MDKKSNSRTTTKVWNFGAYKVAAFKSLRKNGDSIRFNVLKCPDWVNVLAFDRTGKIITVKQFRHALEKTTSELPGGIVEIGIEPLQAIQQELKEETGFIGGEWFFLGKYLANAGLQDNYIHSYFCRYAIPGDSPPEEGASVELLSPEVFWDSVQFGELSQAFVLAIVQLSLQKKFISVKNGCLCTPIAPKVTCRVNSQQSE